MTRRCGTYWSDGTSGCRRLLFVTSGASARPMPAAAAPFVRWRSLVLTNPGEFVERRLEVPVMVPEVPGSQPGDTQFDPNTRFVPLQYANLVAGGRPEGVRAIAARMLLRMSITPAGAAGAQSYPPHVVLKMWNSRKSDRSARTRTVLW